LPCCSLAPAGKISKIHDDCGSDELGSGRAKAVSFIRQTGDRHRARPRSSPHGCSLASRARSGVSPSARRPDRNLEGRNLELRQMNDSSAPETATSASLCRRRATRAIVRIEPRRHVLGGSPAPDAASISERAGHRDNRRPEFRNHNGLLFPQRRAVSPAHQTTGCPSQTLPRDEDHNLPAADEVES